MGGLTNVDDGGYEGIRLQVCCYCGFVVKSS
jgi:hypothetical protein